jgi:hypothetical protein
MRVIAGKSFQKPAHRGGAPGGLRDLFALLLLAAVIFTSAETQEGHKSRPEPLTIEEQGSFAVGGSVVTAPGTFDPINLETAVSR